MHLPDLRCFTQTVTAVLLTACCLFTQSCSTQDEGAQDPKNIPVTTNKADPAHLIPQPLSVVVEDDSQQGQGRDFVLREDISIQASGDTLPSAEYLAEHLRVATGWKVPVNASQANTSGIVYEIQPDLTVEGVTEDQLDEAYVVRSDSHTVRITARTSTGALWGTQTLLQLLGPWVRFDQTTHAALKSIPPLTIKDAPRFSWRGIMVDPSRSFIEKEELLDLIDHMSSYKMNVLHLHLTDDPGWRIQIPNEGKNSDDPINYDLLTEKSGKTAFQADDSKFAPGIPGRTGYYTLEDYRDIVTYANERGITLVPEVDGPGHMESALHAIEQLNSEFSYPKPKGGEQTVPVPDYANNLKTSLDATNPHTYDFMSHVLQVLSENSNSPYLHIGGDEAAVTKHEHYTRYMKTVLPTVKKQQSTPIVWNEALQLLGAQALSDSIVQWWNGEVNDYRDVIDDFIDHGGEFVVSPASHFYYPQTESASLAGPNWACPEQECTLKHAYEFDPQDYMGFSNDDALRGVEGASWSEHLRTYPDLQFSLFPRLLAHAEIGWTQTQQKDWERFHEAVASQGNSLNTTHATFYTSDQVPWKVAAAWSDQLANVDDNLSDETVVGYLSIPGYKPEDVTVTLRITPEGQKPRDIPVRCAVDQSYHLTDEGKTTGRRMNSIVRVYAALGKIPSGSHTADLVITATNFPDTHIQEQFDN